MKRYVVVLIALLLVASGCGGSGAVEPTPPAQETEVPAPAPPEPETAPQPEQEQEEDEVLSQIDATPFKLTDDEAALYAKYIDGMDVSVFMGASPLTVAKVYVQCGIDGHIEAEYNMYAPESRTDTFEQYESLNTQGELYLPVSKRQQYANIFFGLLHEGEFTEADDGSGYIRFVTALDESARFCLQKAEDGMWLVRYNFLEYD